MRKPLGRSVMPTHCRRGSAHVMVLGGGMIVTVAGLSSVTFARVENKAVVDNEAAILARIAARSAVEVGVYGVLKDPMWRVARQNDTWSLDESLGPFKLAFKQVDEVDGNLGDNMDDPVRVYCKAVVRNAVRINGVLLEVAPGVPNAAIGSALHAGGDLVVAAEGALKVVGGIISANDRFMNGGTVSGEVHEPEVTGTGHVVGHVITDVVAKEMPDHFSPGPVTTSATWMTVAGNIEQCVMAQSYNEYCRYGNPNGLYYLDMMNEDITISEVRIHGTLVINAGPAGTVCIERQVLMDPLLPEFPSLVIIGNARFDFTSQKDDSERYLHEVSSDHNFNPPGSPYSGRSNLTLSDRFPSEIRGLVHVIGDLELCRSSRVRGAIACTGNVTV